jgi:hypothetical protein
LDSLNSKVFLLFTECKLMIYNPKNHDPLQIHKVNHIVKSLTYLPRRSDDLESSQSEQKSNILYITDKNDMYILGEPSSIKPKVCCTCFLSILLLYTY